VFEWNQVGVAAAPTPTPMVEGGGWVHRLIVFFFFFWKLFFLETSLLAGTQKLNGKKAACTKMLKLI
jgi:hypothetical protein